MIGCEQDVWYSTVCSSGQNQAVAGFPHRRLHDVGQAHAPLALAFKMDGHGLLILVSRFGQCPERSIEFVAQLSVLKLDLLNVIEPDRPDTP